MFDTVTKMKTGLALAPARSTSCHLVSILGSPNVGKSTLFNRLLGRRRAITAPTPGVTRDPIEAPCTIDGTEFTLIDTGGLLADGNEEISQIVGQRSLHAANDSTLVLLVVDVGGLSINDEMLIEQLRPMTGKLMLVVNKIDNEKREGLLWNFLQLGFDKVVGVSAAHGRNFIALKQEIVSFLNHSTITQHENDTYLHARIAILGKPNTGKSTLSNRLVGEKKSIVFEEPGTTRDVVEGQFTYRGKLFRVLDTAGIRRKTRVEGTVEYYSVSQAIRSLHRCDIVFLLIDAVDGLKEQDKKIAALAVKEGRGVILVLNKWAMLTDIPNRLQAMKDRLTFLFPILNFAPVIAISAKTGYGINKLLDTSVEVMTQLNRKVATPELNQALQTWVKEVPPIVKGRSIKLRYATQISSNPMHFVFFAGRLANFPKSYRRYLANKIRSFFGLISIPVNVEIRQS